MQQPGQPGGVAEKLASLQLAPEEMVQAIAHGISKLESDLKKSQVGSPKDLEIIAQIKDLYMQLVQSLDSDGSEAPGGDQGVVSPEAGAAKVQPAL